MDEAVTGGIVGRIAVAALILAGCLRAVPPTERLPPAPPRLQVLIDADTANEVDDLFAIVRAFHAPHVDVVALTGAQYVTQRAAPADSALRSHRLNERLLAVLGRTDVPAAPLTILTLGAVTNVASAILMAPDIVPRIRLWSIMLRYEAEGWSRSEFNANNDQLAVDALFATPGLDLTVMTATASRDLVFSRAESGDKLAGRGELGRFLLDYWDRFVEETPWWDSLLWKEHRSWRMWDVALVEALLDPRLGERRRIEAPALQDGTMLETTVDVFTAIDAAGMADRFWRSLVPPEGSR